MKRLLNTLFVTTQGAYLSKQRETVVISVDKEVKLRLPIHTLGSLVCFGQVSCSPFLLGLCAERGVSVSFLTEYGRFMAKVVGPISGNVLLRREQYRQADDPKSSAKIARAVVTGKLYNSRSVLRRAMRDHPDKTGDSVKAVERSLSGALTDLTKELPLDSVRGVEGDAARRYFSVFNKLITAQNEEFPFNGRSRRPPLDKVNSLLSFLYTLLLHDVRSACEVVGLDPAVGFLHRDRPGRPSLALDLMEEFRSILSDRLVLSLINLRQVQPKGFEIRESGGVIMDDKTRKIVLVAWQERKRDTVMHPFIKEKIRLGLFPYVQALLMARHLRGDLDGYPPVIWR